MHILLHSTTLLVSFYHQSAQSMNLNMPLPAELSGPVIVCMYVFMCIECICVCVCVCALTSALFEQYLLCALYIRLARAPVSGDSPVSAACHSLHGSAGITSALPSLAVHGFWDS